MTQPSRGHLLTEQINPQSTSLDQLSSLEIVDLFNQEDLKTIDAVKASREVIAQAIDITSESLRGGGRLFYIGAGTSGRLGVLDAVECPPTFCTPPDLVQGILAGGEGAMFKSSEALEDRSEDGAQAMIDHGITFQDVVVGITAGGTTPYVRGALEKARKIGAKTVFISCVPSEQVKIDVDVDIRLLTGAEILAGSTRLKAGTVTKMVLNIISTGVMVKLGKVYGNRMIDVSVTNSKLLDRALRIITDLTNLDRQTAQELLQQSGLSVKLALLMHWKNLNLTQAQTLLTENDGNLHQSSQL
ncbi:MAG: N-acetylmuramic acid 6-phosphate etherase [Cyanobacterium sp. T60_A2020_053]|nr:N-acetylmuramic acid 6-phosphate etherase [Cyanobacterium sp. T60_A2020_053]